jgi:hypothetical protein
MLQIVVKINSCFSSNEAHMVVSLLDRHLAFLTIIDGRQRKAKYGQIQEDRE